MAFVTSALLRAITWKVPEDQLTTPSWFIGMIFGVVAGTCYLALSGNRKVAVANDAARARALAAVDDGQARLLVYRQGFVGKLAGVDILVDGEVRTQLKSPRFAVLVLAPGRREVIASVQGKRTDPMAIDLAAGETAALRVDMAIGRARLVRDTDVDAVRRTLATVPMVVA